MLVLQLLFEIGLLFFKFCFPFVRFEELGLGALELGFEGRRELLVVGGLGLWGCG